MAAYVLDASALIAFLVREPGYELVERLIDDCWISTVNLSEVVAFLGRGGAGAAEIREEIHSLSLNVVGFDEALAVDAGLMARQTRQIGLSLADRACLALARRQAVPVITADRVWADIADAVGVEIVLIR